MGLRFPKGRQLGSLEAIGAVVRVAVAQRDLAHIVARPAGKTLGDPGGGHLGDKVVVVFRLAGDDLGETLAGGDANLFRYVGNNPIGWGDPTGQAPTWWERILDWYDWYKDIKEQLEPAKAMKENIDSASDIARQMHEAQTAATNRRNQCISDANSLSNIVGTTDTSKSEEDAAFQKALDDQAGGGLAAAKAASWGFHAPITIGKSIANWPDRPVWWPKKWGWPGE